MDLEINREVIEKLDLIIRYQNIQLLKKIAKWKRIDEKELIKKIIK
jgi:hypothetical protein